jgi:DNA modification methylase
MGVEGGMRLIYGDCVEEIKKLEANSVDAVITDPPYNLAFMGKSFDTFKNPLHFQQWAQAWATEALRVLKPGGYLLAFGGTRTYHRLVCGLEDAGFVIKDTLCWLYGSGFPKSYNISKGMDAMGKRYEFFDKVRNFLKDSLAHSGYSIKQINEMVGFATTGSGMAGHWFANITQQTLPTKEQWFRLKKILNFDDTLDEIFRSVTNPNERPVIGKLKNPASSIYSDKKLSKKVNITSPVSVSAKIWDGYGTALKPAHEPIVLAQKPLDGIYCQNIEKWSVGALNIDSGRIDVDPNDVNIRDHTKHTRKTGSIWGEAKGADKNLGEKGRFPANLLLDEEAAEILDEQSGVLKSGDLTGQPRKNNKNVYGDAGSTYGNPRFHKGDSGGASRFFYTAKASTKERGKGNNHPTVIKPIALLMYLARLVLPQHKPVVWLDPFLGSGTSALVAAKLNDEEGYQINFIGIDQKGKYLEIAKQRLADYNKCVQLRIPIQR